MKTVTKLLVIATIFSLPTYLIRFSIFGVPTTVLEIVIYVSFLSFLLEKPLIEWGSFYRNYKYYIFSVTLILCGLILSTIISHHYREGFGIIKGWFFDPLLFSFVLIHHLKSRNDAQRVLTAFYFSACFVGLIAWIYFLLGNLTYDGRLAAFYLSPNYLAMFLAPALFAGIFLAAQTGSEEKFKRYLLLASLIMLSGVIFLTYSYAAWLALFLSGLIIAWLIKKVTKKSLITTAFVLAILFLSQINNSKLQNIFSNRSSLESRMMIWKSSALMLKHNPIFGIGPGSFQNTYLRYQQYFPPYLEWAVPEPHNLYLAFWLQSGIIGFFGFALLVFAWLKRTASDLLKNQKNSPLLAVPVALIVYTLIHGLVDTTYWKNDLSLVFWIFVTLGAALSEIDAVELPISSVDEKEDVARRR